jgi:hypothetical protein
MTTARFYRWLVRLHPRPFRDRFGPEMLCVYDEAERSLRPRLLADAVISLLRQWVARSRYWIAGAAILGAGLQFAVAGTAWLSVGRRALTGSLPAPALSRDPSAPAGLLLLGAGLVCAILLLMIALASLLRGAARRKT